MGGSIEVRGGPWLIQGNDYLGPPANTYTSQLVRARTTHDLVVRDNHAHLADPTRVNSGAADRFVLLKDQSWGDIIDGNRVNDGYGQPDNAYYPPVNPTDSPRDRNAPENILLESYAPHFEGRPVRLSPDGRVLQVPHLRGGRPQPGAVVAVLTGLSQGQWRLIAQQIDEFTYLLDQPLIVENPESPTVVVSITEGAIGLAIRGNTFDLSTSSQGNNGIQFGGNLYGCQVLRNTFIGAIPMYVRSYWTNRDGIDTNDPAQSYGKYGAPDGWTHLPLLGLVVAENTFQDPSTTSPSVIMVEHNSNRAFNTRTYLTATVAVNLFEYGSAPPSPSNCLRLGMVGYSAENKAEVGELIVSAVGNWGKVPAGATAPSVRVEAGSISSTAGGPSNQGLRSTTFPLRPRDPSEDSQSGTFAIALGQDGDDRAGLDDGVLRHNGYQDYHIRIYNLQSNLIRNFTIGRLNGGSVSWRTQYLANWKLADQFVVARLVFTADLYFQPEVDDAGHSYHIDINYENSGTPQTVFASGVIVGSKVGVRPRISPGFTPGAYSGDFTGDGKADFAVYRPATAEFIYLNSMTGQVVMQSLGRTGDVPAPADFDNDGRTDFAVYTSTGSGGETNLRFVYIPSNSPLPPPLIAQYLGLAGDLPVPANYDGDGGAEFAVYRPSTGEFIYFLGGQVVRRTVGQPGDVPVPANYVGDGRAEFAVYRPSTGQFFYFDPSTSTTMSHTLGIEGDIPVPRDYTGDGKVEMAVYRPSATQFLYRDPNLQDPIVTQLLGLPGALPTPADFDGDGKVDFAVYRPWDCIYFYLKSKDSGSLAYQYFGLPGDYPLP